MKKRDIKEAIMTMNAKVQVLSSNTLRTTVRKRSSGRIGPLGCALVRFFQIVGCIDIGK
jgi:hypothetical protein